ncbi:GreA/GreB family elongation factor [Sphingobacterium sp. SRCM116780]|uniref:GreA/GreB family elongation factor n=1 Tax=Sphingobacterium sp. SRCM116780 TaxID=2907623 RepID=UPI001F2D6A94|nr:GreA/GreB family elongation factor [Sphingobacterium sp. SRCM116780]UIR56775.1 GreA/GreB family elongation factor [Sphingobacterium sp. SRCM116780]
MEKDYTLLRSTLMEACKQHVEDRIANLILALKSAHEASTDDTKSSAGDKYETTREMMQQDIARCQMQLAEAKKDESTLNGLVEPYQSDFVQDGSIVETNKGIYFIAISIGIVQTPYGKVFVISNQSPIGKLLLKKKVDESFMFNSVEQKLLSIN